MIILKNFIFNELEVNAFVLHDESGACLIVDPGCKSPVQQQTLVKYITENNLRPEGIVLTHGHFDHVAGVALAKNEYSCPVLMHKDDLFLVKDAAQHASLFGIKMENPPAPDRYLEDGDHIKLGSSRYFNPARAGPFTREHLPVYGFRQPAHLRRCAVQWQHRPDRPLRREL